MIVASTTPTGSIYLPGKLTTKTRADGRRQVVYNGWLLYRHSGDTHPGDTDGDKVIDEWGRWNAISPDQAPPPD